jgi:prefoldin subunit 5
MEPRSASATDNLVLLTRARDAIERLQSDLLLSQASRRNAEKMADEMRAKYSAAEKRATDLDAALSETRQELDDLYETHRHQLRATGANATELQDRLSGISDELRLRGAASSALTAERNALHEQLMAANNQCSRLAAELSQLRAEHESLRAETAATRGSEADVQKRSAAHAGRAAALTEDLSRARAAAAAADRAASESRVAADTLKAELAVATERAQSLSAAADALRAEKTALRASLAQVCHMKRAWLPSSPPYIHHCHGPLLPLCSTLDTCPQAQADNTALATSTRGRMGLWLNSVLAKFDGLRPSPPVAGATPVDMDDPAVAAALLEGLPHVRSWFERNAAAVERQASSDT